MTQEVQHTSDRDQDHLSAAERLISDRLEFSSGREFWDALPYKIPYHAFERILAHLNDQNKIMIDKDGRVLWIFVDNPKLQRLHESSIRLR